MKQAPRNDLILMNCSAYRVAAETFTCALYRNRALHSDTVYTLEVRIQCHFARACLGRDLAWATEVFHTVVRNTVCPCTLMDVLEELYIRRLRAGYEEG